MNQDRDYPVVDEGFRIESDYVLSRLMMIYRSQHRR
jgi:hypothetical protein